MNLQNLDLNVLIVFQAIYREKNVTRAAEKLHISQPAVSNSLNKLRKYFDDPLFVKTSQGMVPTSFAEDISEGIFEALGNLDNLLSLKAQFAPEKFSYTFYVSMSDSSESLLMTKLLNAIEFEAPKVKFFISHHSPHDRKKYLENGKLDLAIYSHFEGQTGSDAYNRQFSSVDELYYEKLFDESLVGVACQGHADVIDGKMSLNRYVDLPQIYFSPHGEDSKFGVVDMVLQKMGKKRDVRVFASSSASLAKMVGETQMIGAISDKFIETVFDVYKVQSFEIPLEMPKFVMAQYWHQRTAKSHPHQWLRQRIKEVSVGI